MVPPNVVRRHNELMAQRERVWRQEGVFVPRAVRLPNRYMTPDEQVAYVKAAARSQLLERRIARRAEFANPPVAPVRGGRRASRPRSRARRVTRSSSRSPGPDSDDPAPPCGRCHTQHTATRLRIAAAAQSSRSPHHTGAGCPGASSRSSASSKFLQAGLDGARPSSASAITRQWMRGGCS